MKIRVVKMATDGTVSLHYCVQDDYGELARLLSCASVKDVIQHPKLGVIYMDEENLTRFDSKKNIRATIAAGVPLVGAVLFAGNVIDESDQGITDEQLQYLKSI